MRVLNHNRAESAIPILKETGKVTMRCVNSERQVTDGIGKEDAVNPGKGVNLLRPTHNMPTIAST